MKKNDELFVDLLNKVRVGNIDDDIEKLLKARFIHESDESYSKDALHLYAENETAIKRNDAVLNECKLYTIEADVKISDNCKYPFATIQAAQNQKQTSTRGLSKLLKFKIVAKMMLTVNVDIQDRLINGQTGNISHIEFVRSSVRKLWIKFSDEQAGLKAMRSSYLGRQNSWVLIKKCEAVIPIKKGSVSPSIKRTQFLLILAGASTVHKVQGLSLEQSVIKNHLDQDKCILQSVG